MTDALLLTKLYVPPSRPKIVLRPRLIERLNEGLSSGRKLTLISASAGFGKTTLISEWVTEGKRPVAWLSLDEGDNDPTRFLTYLVAALQTIAPKIGVGVLSALQSPQPPPSEVILTTLLNEITTLPDHFILVLDDYHIIDSKPVYEDLTFLLEHLPPQMHLAIATREDPPMPLARLRARGQLTELRATDLRFSPTEAAEFLNRVMGLNLSAEDIAALETRTEGWVAGLQLAAISMQGHKDAAGFIQSFTGSHRFVMDYLLEEVLHQQSESIQTFLLQTSILDRMCGPLCDAILLDSSVSGQSTLEYLERINLFIIPLDNERRWYRYHHLFRDLLLNRLLNAYSGQVEELHRQASCWFASQNFPEEAIAHALAARDYDRAAVFVEQAAQQLDMKNCLVAITRWIEAIPDQVVEAHPWLCIYRAWGYQWMGRRDSVELWLNAAEASLPFALTLGKPDNERDHLLGHMAAIRAHAAITGENIPRALEEGQKALSLLPERDEMRCETAVAIGGAYWSLGRVIDSEQAFASARAAALTCNHLTMAVPSTCYVGMQQVKQGRLATAHQTYQEALHLAVGPDGWETPVAGFPNIKLGDLCREWNELERAEKLLLRGVQQCILLGQSDVLVDGYLCLTRFQMAVGNLDGANENLRQADLVVAKTKVDPFLQTRLEDCRLRLWAREDDYYSITRWMETSGLSVESPFSYYYDLHHVNLARALVSLGANTRSQALLNQAVSLLDRLHDAADRAGWVHEKIQILILRTLAEKALGREDATPGVLLQALALAEPGGYVRIFVDEGEAMRLLIEKQSHNRDHPLRGYAHKLLAAFTQPGAGPKSATPALHQVQRGASVIHYKSDIIEPLSNRELEVLKLLRSDLSGPEIALQLSVSINTFRTHTKNIFIKLGVNDRRAAIRRAEERNTI
jgi:LuxR family maltose regulon positive regulatory protein